MDPISRSTGSYGCCSQKETTHEISEVDIHGAQSADSETYAMCWTSQEDEIASILEGCVSTFWSGLQKLQDINVEDLVFCEPQKDAEPHITPTLQMLATTNLPFMKYHDWIITLISDTQKLDCGSSERCGRIKQNLLDDLWNEWTKLEELKCRAWQLASLRSPEPGSAQITNTCENIIR
jgi:hypothetical protein